MTKYEELDQGRVKFVQDPFGTTLYLLPSPIFFNNLFLAGWLIAWFAGETFAIRELQKGTNGYGLFLFGWLVAWTAGGAMALYTLIWQLFGTHYLRIDAAGLSVWKSVLGFFYTRKNFRLADVKNLRVTHSTGSDGEGGQWTTIYLAFDYGNRTVAIFQGIDELTANFVCNQLKIKSPQFRIGNSN